MYTDFSSYFGAITSVEYEHLRVTLALLRSDRDERDFLIRGLDEYRDQAFSANQISPKFFRISKRPSLPFACAEKNTPRPDYPLPLDEPMSELRFRRIRPQQMTYEEYRRLTIALAILRSPGEDSEFLSWWLYQWGAPAISGQQPDPQTEDDIEEQRLFLESLGVDCRD